MELDAIFAGREDWQRKAFEDIKGSLIYARDDRFIHYDSARGDHLVMIYGRSQVGKTTLILTMLGIREGDCFREVEDILRAGIPLGNSSTSTAIVYSCSKDDRYGCAETSMDKFPPQEVPSFDREGLLQRLKKVREAVESHKADADKILYITIPRRYFAGQDAGERISVLDLPGIESRNRKEDDHVRDLMVRYLPIASACILTCRADDIQSMENLRLPDGSNWKRLDHRFILVLTFAYSRGSVIEFFQQERQKRATNFYQHVMQCNEESVRYCLGQDNRTAFFPIEVGDSLEKLAQTQHLAPEDWQELQETRDRVLSDLKGWIADHQEYRLKAAISDLRDRIERDGESAIRKTAHKIDEIRLRIEKDREEAARVEAKIGTLVGGGSRKDGTSGDTSLRGELKEELRSLQESRDQLANAGSGITGLYQALTTRLQDEGVELCSDGAYWKDKGKVVYTALRSVSEEKSRERMETLKPLADLSASGLLREIDQQCMILWKQWDPEPQKLFAFKKGRVYTAALKCITAAVESAIGEGLDRAVQPYIQERDKLIREKERAIRNVERKAQNGRLRIQELEEDIRDQEARSKEREDERRLLERRKKKDHKTLDMYRKYTRQALTEQRRDIIEKINSQVPTDDKLLLLLFLGVLEKDYQKVTGGAYGS